MANIFQELQMLSENINNDIIDSRKELNKIVEVFKSRECYLEEITWCAAETFRNLNVQTLIDADAFMIQDDVAVNVLPEELRHDSYGMCRGVWLRYSGRLVYPVKDIKGDVMGWCGYDMFESPKYLDSDNYGYKAKFSTFYGMERLEEAYKSNRNIFIVEGIVCCLFLRQEGFLSFASLGSHLTPYVIQILKRFGRRVTFITDADEAGNKYKAQVLRELPQARCLQSRIAKDVDDSRKVDPEFVKELKKIESNPFYKSPLFK